MIVLGAVLLGLSICMLVLAASLFTATTIPPWLDAVGFVCFWFFWIPGILGLVCLVRGIIKRSGKKHADA